MSNATTIASFWHAILDQFQYLGAAGSGGYGVDFFKTWAAGGDLFQYTGANYTCSILGQTSGYQTITSGPCDEYLSWDDYNELRGLPSWWSCPIYYCGRPSDTYYGWNSDNLLAIYWEARKALLENLDVPMISGSEVQSPLLWQDYMLPYLTTTRFFTFASVGIEAGNFSVSDNSDANWSTQLSNNQLFQECMGIWSFNLARLAPPFTGPVTPWRLWTSDPQPDLGFYINYLLEGDVGSDAGATNAINLAANALSVFVSNDTSIGQHNAKPLAIRKGYAITLPAPTGTIDDACNRLALAFHGLKKMSLIVPTKRGTFCAPEGYQVK